MLLWTFIIVLLLNISLEPAVSKETFKKCLFQEKCVPLRTCDPFRKILRQRGNNMTESEKHILNKLQCNRDKEKVPLNEQIFVCCPTAANKLPAVDSCGHTPIKPRISGGQPTSYKEFPWMALVQYERISKFGVENRFHCGGSLINSRYVLTAAHCVDIDSNVELVDRGSNDDYVVRVRLGEWNIKDCPDQLNKISECARPHLDIVVEETIKHPKFRRIKNRFLNDIALLRLNMPVSFTKAISPICLKMGDDIGLPSYKSPVVGTKMTVAGWGKTGVDAPMSSQLLKTELIRMPLSSCSKHYGSLNNFYICAGTNNGNDTCKGDSGGPLMSLFGDKTYLVGITSFGATNCGARDFPSLYVRTLPYLNWIEKNLRL